MALDVAAIGEAGKIGESFINIGEGLFGTSATTGGSGTSTGTRKTTEQLQLDEEAITRMIQEVLGGTQGLASIFGGEQATGLFSSSVAAQESGDLVTKLIGELAKLTGTKTQDVAETQATTSKQTSESGGLLDQVFGGLF